jgi:hypothetical protein
MPPDVNLLDFFFGGIVANIPLWVFTLFSATYFPFSFITLITLTTLGIIGGFIAGYILKLKTPELYKWAPLLTGLLAFFASILILESISPELTDIILLPSFILGTYLGVKICSKYPLNIKTRATSAVKIIEPVTENGEEANK